ncbi:MAG: hypothetical protein AAGF89_15455 [Bacteroidota bacterium]
MHPSTVSVYHAFTPSWLWASLRTFAIQNQWLLLLWLLTTIGFGIWSAYLFRLWKKRSEKGKDALGFLLVRAFQAFRWPLLGLFTCFTGITALGLWAGAQRSIGFFMLLSTAMIGLFSVLAWLRWPTPSAEGNLFDLMPLPTVQWPHYENAQDRQARAWVEQRVRELKSEPPQFSGERFGTTVFEVAEELAKIYQKPTILSVQTQRLLLGLERTAADMKMICNHLPLAGHLTLAEMERPKY